jgi:hypothetical protein
MTLTDKAAQLLARYPGPVMLYPSRKKWLTVFLGGAAFTAGGVMMVRSGEPLGWFVLGFFALVAVIAAAALLPGAGKLTLDRDGFEATTLFRRHRARWADTDGFDSAVVPPSHQALVVYDDRTLPSGGLAGINTSITGRNSALGDTYGFAAADLAALMAAWRERAVRGAAP